MVAVEEYDFRMGRSLSALVAAFALFAVLLLGSLPVAAQINGVPTSVTSTGFGGHFDRAPGIPPSVTSLGPKGYNDRTHLFVGSGFPPSNPAQLPHHPHHPGQSSHGGGYYPVYTPVYILDPSQAYSPELSNAPMNDAGGPAENQPAGPTIIDRRASDQSSQAVEAEFAKRSLAEPRQASPEPAPVAAQPQAAPVQDQPQTVLIFKDGHQLEVRNYAIIGSMLYDLTPGRRNKVALSDLDLRATARENDTRGVDFQLPAGPDSN